jgi:methyl-accepting chemotaxis protein/methyl-accepting chemotaxis protein-1 (serine sensor receptor)
MSQSQLTVGKKFALTGALLMGLGAVLGGVALVGLGGLQGTVGRLTENALPGLSQCSKVESALNEMRGDVLKHIGSSDPEVKKTAEANIRKLRQMVSQSLAEYEKKMNDAEDRKLFADVAPAFARYYAICDGVLEVSRNGQSAPAYKKYEDESVKTGVYRAAKAAIQALTELNRRNGTRYSAAAEAAGARARWLIWLLLCVSVLSGSGLLYVIVRGMNRTLRQAVAELSDGADQVAHAASQVSSSSQALARGSSSQAASLEETSASTTQIHAMAQKNTEHSNSAADLVAQSQQEFAETNRSLEEMVVAMGEIDDSSGKIAKIIKVIDEIAFQTNILALNAAVEAARAGEAGMGFAVVADEVRNLAQRCAEAAKNTAALIEESIAKSRKGKEKVDLVARAIQSITAESADIRGLVDEVKVGSQEQARGIDQIGKAISQMEQVTQTTAASAEESAAAAEELTAQSEALRGVVEQLSVLVKAARGRTAVP